MTQYNIALFSLIFTLTIPLQSQALSCKQTPPQCSSYNYKYTSCPGEYVACPFDTSLKQCDNEALSKDFKFAINSGGNGWNQANSSTHYPNYSGAFIVGVASSSNYCGTSVNSYANPTVGKHSHKSESSTYYWLTLANLSREKASGSAFKSFCSDTSNFKHTENTISTTATGTKATTSETRPGNFAVDGYFYSYPFNEKTTQATIPSSKPSCTTLGYKNKASDCPGSYITCPFDDAAVMCDMQAKAGEIKFSLKFEGTSGDHNGWLLCDGRRLASIDGGKYANSELKTILSNNGFGANLPNYQGEFLRMKGTSPYNTSYKSATSYATRQYDGISGHTHTVNFNVSKFDGDRTCGQNDGNDMTKPYSVPTAISPDRTSAIGGRTEPDEITTTTRPPNFAAFIYIYSGKLVQN